MILNNDLFSKHLQGMIKFKTVSTVNPDDMDKQPFLDFHKYLEETYPLIHKTLKREVIGKVGLLYTWKGTGKSKSLPLLLTAHQDVVPEGNHDLWKYPPFEGVIDSDNILWGRGTTDSKCNIQAYMDAIELLIADGFKPDYDLYLAFGYNEEIMGGPGAAAQIIAGELKKRNIELGMVIDECGGIEDIKGKKVAHIYTCEKGYADFEFTKVDNGGHAAFPRKHSALGIIGKTACAIEDNPMPQVLTEPIVKQFKAISPFIKDDLGNMLNDSEKNWQKLKPLFDNDVEYNALTRTTFAVTMAKGSEQANILPENASLIVNTRLIIDDTIENVQKHFEAIVPEGVTVKLLKGNNPPTISSTESEGYKTIQKVLESKYPKITLVPSMLIGGTDSRYYCELSPTHSVYRITGLQHNSKTGGAHKVNEHIDCSILSDNVDFYARLLLAYGK